MLPRGQAIALVPLHDTRVAAGGRPLYCVHPVGGNVFCYWEFARGFNGGGVFGLQSRGVQPGFGPETSIEEMAESYINQILPSVSDRILNLVGWSMGGLISLEMARQLAANGRRGRVVMLDTWVAKPGAINQSNARMLSAFFNDMSGGSLSFEAGMFTDDIAAGLEEGRHRMSAKRFLPADFHLGVLRRLYDTFFANYAAIHAYQARSVAADILYFKATRQPADRFPTLDPIDVAPAWKGRISPCREDVDADHFSLMSADVLRPRLGLIESFLSCPTKES